MTAVFQTQTQPNGLSLSPGVIHTVNLSQDSSLQATQTDSGDNISKNIYNNNNESVGLTPESWSIWKTGL